jgi:hypothetical protein
MMSAKDGLYENPLPDVSESYNSDYFIRYGDGAVSNYVNYEDCQELVGEQFEAMWSIAPNLFYGKPVVDAACAYGHGVARLRGLSVDAYGFDLSEFAVAMGHNLYGFSGNDIWVQSMT